MFILLLGIVFEFLMLGLKALHILALPCFHIFLSFVAVSLQVGPDLRVILITVHVCPFVCLLG